MASERVNAGSGPRRSGARSGIALFIALAALIALVGILVPEAGRSRDARRSRAERSDLEALDAAFSAWSLAHGGLLPESDAGVFDAETLAKALVDGAASRLPAGVPPNPWNGSNEIKLVAVGSAPEPDGSSGWLFVVAERRFRSNARRDD